jgi:hypothetical protein
MSSDRKHTTARDADAARGGATTGPARRASNVTSRHRDEADRLREEWREASEPDKWTDPSLWWHPAVDELVRVLVTERAPIRACVYLARARAEAGLGLGRTLDDLNALYRQLPARIPPPHVVRIVVDTWTATRKDQTTIDRHG